MRSSKYDILPPSRLVEIVSYNPVTGDFHWRSRPECSTSWNTRYAGAKITCPAKSGYLMLGYTSGWRSANYLLHRAAIAYVTGVWPDGDVDHINGDKRDNRLSNLRVATSTQNHMNVHKVKSPWGFKGVFRHPDTGRYRATIRKGGKNTHLGYHATPEEAARAYDRAAVQMFGEFARTNESLGLIDA